jgi:succinyl-CoA synthetase beta subunit
MLDMKVGQFPVEAVLVEEKIAIEREFFLSFTIDDAARAPVIIFASGGATGIGERAASTKRIDPVKHGNEGPPPRGISDGNPKSQDPNPREKGDQR